MSPLLKTSSPAHYPQSVKLAQKLPPFLSLILFYMCRRQELQGYLTNYACAAGDPTQGRHRGGMMKRVAKEVTFSSKNSDRVGTQRRKIRLIEVNTKFVIKKNLHVKCLCGRCLFIKVYRLEIQSVMLVFSTQLCEL
jgi:hypothetical protein